MVKNIGIHYQLRTDSATVPITFHTELEARNYLQRAKKEHPFFHSLLKLYKITVYQDEEMIRDNKLYKAPKRGQK